MLNQIAMGGFVSLVNFGIHALMTGLIVLATHRIAAATDELHVFVRVTSLMLVTLVGGPVSAHGEDEAELGGADRRGLPGGGEDLALGEERHGLDRGVEL